MQFIKASPEIKHVNLPNGSIANVPLELSRILASPEIASLKELALRSVKKSLRLEECCLPQNLIDLLAVPNALCSCQMPIFCEAFAAFFYE